jgi:hypothetical protein
MQLMAFRHVLRDCSGTFLELSNVRARPRPLTILLTAVGCSRRLGRLIRADGHT